MADSKLSRGQILELYAKLSDDDRYRERFENNPAAALTELGVSAEAIAAVDTACLAPVRLAPKRLFAEALARLDDKNWADCLQMIVPNLRLDAAGSNPDH